MSLHLVLSSLNEACFTMVCEVNGRVCQWSLLGLRRSIKGSFSLNKRDISIKQLSISLGNPFIMLSDSSLSVTNRSTF